MSKKKMAARTTAMIRQIEKRAPVAAQGLTDLYALREALHHAAMTMGLHVVLDQDSDPDLADYLGIGAIAAVEGGLAGAALGALVGSLLRSVSAGVFLGALIGLVGGGSLGVKAVGHGWRLRALWSADGEATALLEPWS